MARDKGMALSTANIVGNTDASKEMVETPGIGKRICIKRASYNVDVNVAAGTFFWTDGTTPFDHFGMPLKGVPYGFTCGDDYYPLAENAALTLNKDSETTSTNAFVLYFIQIITS